MHYDVGLGNRLGHVRQAEFEYDRQACRSQNSPHDRTPNLAGIEPGREEDAEEKHNQIQRGEMRVELNGRVLVRQDQRGIFQADKGDEQSDADGDSVAHTAAHGV